MKFAVTITLKKDVLDPQGKVVGQTLKNIGIENLNSIRQGKFFEIDLNFTESPGDKRQGLDSFSLLKSLVGVLPIMFHPPGLSYG